MTEHTTQLDALNQALPLRDKIVATHQSVKEIFPFIARIAIAIYDADTAMLKTFIHSSGDANPLDNYQASLKDSPSLKAILDKGLPRVVNNLLTYDDGKRKYNERIGRQGYAASYTLPMFDNGTFIGFIFFNSDQADVFTEPVLKQIDLYGHIIALMVINELTSIQTLSAVVKSTGKITHVRDPETGSHLDRMSRYSRLIASALATKYQLNDEYIEHVFMFSPLHDIGKIGIPDNILLKPGTLNDDETRIMRTHTEIGRKMIDDMLTSFGLDKLAHMDMLRNIAEYHHEAVNGQGYPSGLKGDEIPIEARIVAVADVFDALTSRRSYKNAWSNAEAIESLREMAGEKLDEDCVNALIENMDQVEIIQAQFKEDEYG